jgi:hypothetical protein
MLGANDMALDNCGRVKRWTCTAPVTTRGPGGIGVVNFGHLDEPDIRAPIETLGVGARGFNLYDGTLQKANFDSITTHGDGAVGIQIAKPLPTLVVRHDVTTAGRRRDEPGPRGTASATGDRRQRQSRRAHRRTQGRRKHQDHR